MEMRRAKVSGPGGPRPEEDALVGRWRCAGRRRRRGRPFASSTRRGRRCLTHALHLGQLQRNNEGWGNNGTVPSLPQVEVVEGALQVGRHGGGDFGVARCPIVWFVPPSEKCTLALALAGALSLKESVIAYIENIAYLEIADVDGRLHCCRPGGHPEDALLRAALVGEKDAVTQALGRVLERPDLLGRARRTPRPRGAAGRARLSRRGLVHHSLRHFLLESSRPLVVGRHGWRKASSSGRHVRAASKESLARLVLRRGRCAGGGPRRRCPLAMGVSASRRPQGLPPDRFRRSLARASTPSPRRRPR